MKRLLIPLIALLWASLLLISWSAPEPPENLAVQSAQDQARN